MTLPKPEDAVPKLSEIQEFASLLQIYARHIEDHASIPDLIGMGYAARSAWAYMKQIRWAVKEFLPDLPFPEGDPIPEADRLEPVEPGDDVVPPWIEENGA